MQDSLYLMLSTISMNIVCGIVYFVAMIVSVLRAAWQDVNQEREQKT